jgi:hypothetical protein
MNGVSGDGDETRVGRVMTFTGQSPDDVRARN